MASVYILYSASLNKYYIGSCKEIESRLNDHLSKHFVGAFTSKASDWIIYLELNDLSYSQARKIELYIKKMKSRTYIQNLKKYPELIGKITSKFKD
jgi:putative endonuclease